MSEVTTIGLDIAKHLFHAHGADESGRAMFSREIRRGKLLDFFAAHPWTPLQTQEVFRSFWHVAGCCHLSGL